MTDDTPSPTPAGRLLVALEAFYVLYRELLPLLDKDQLRLISRRLDRYAVEVDDDATRAPPACP